MSYSPYSPYEKEEYVCKKVLSSSTFNHPQLKCEVSINKENNHEEDEGSVYEKFLCKRSGYR